MYMFVYFTYNVFMFVSFLAYQFNFITNYSKLYNWNAYFLIQQHFLTLFHVMSLQLLLLICTDKNLLN